MAQYSRPPHQNEFYSEQEQQDFTESLPPLSLKFSLPPVDNVSLCDADDRIQTANEPEMSLQSHLGFDSRKLPALQASGKRSPAQQSIPDTVFEPS